MLECSPHQLRRVLGGLFTRRSLWLPTWRGWVAILCMVIVGAWIAVRMVHPFLAMSEPVRGELLVVEGWAADYMIAEAIADFQRHPYESLVFTGGPIEKGAPFSEHQSFAEFGAATAIALAPQLAPRVHAAPAPDVRQDRTYTSALALKKWCREHRGRVPSRINVVSSGTHSRRTHLLFEKAFGPKTKVGILAVHDRNYDPKRWWASSAGVRSVIEESIAYGYAQLLFWPEAEPQ